jgi:putative transposase
VLVENLNVAGNASGDGDACNERDAAWKQFMIMLRYEPDLHGCHVVQVETRGTIKESASCGDSEVYQRLFLHIV